MLPIVILHQSFTNGSSHYARMRVYISTEAHTTVMMRTAINSILLSVIIATLEMRGKA